ncbi:aminodeoxychorismate synthase component I [Pseudoxanthomonas sp. CAU 1598]|uniref:Aminodeoxychorismate synthase component I n=1 Tax=Pseudomarimonas arenosa TaxID=2774145 RepID=A0AAW3ZNG8_9GAMM|nr:aminodeoxychorismate synthase component I [Pseudomarimonas arenosa]
MCRLAASPDLLALQAGDPGRFPLLLESAAEGARGRFDLLLVGSAQRLVLNGDGQLAGENLPFTPQGGFLTALDVWWQQLALPVSGPRIQLESAPLFSGGWALFLGYELAGEIEPRLRLSAPESGLPIAVAQRCPAAIVRDRRTGDCWIECEGDQPELFDALCAELGANSAVRAPASEASPVTIEKLSEEPAERYVQGVRRCLEYIAAGDVFQVNLSRGWQAELRAGQGATEVYSALRRSNPAPFAGLMVLDGDQWVISSSPERLVSRRGERLETRPIAGTRARGSAEQEAALVAELLSHPKERAEHIMLIDLERNDLGRVSVPGSVQVDDLMAVETYAHVHHIESTVSGHAKPALSPGDLIRAVFPGGTITGCPKVRCMEIIAELEQSARGPYTGAIGWLSRSADMDLNILIRSLSLVGQTLRFRAGAGVVADSDPEAELAETRAKARGLLAALQG